MLRGLLASLGYRGQPVKGIYFFPGEQRNDNTGLYTVHPLDDHDLHWNSDPSTRTWVMDRIAQTHANTIVMSYWSNMPPANPMTVDKTSLSGVLDSVQGQGRHMLIMPAIESGAEWEFAREFPPLTDDELLVSGLVERIGDMVKLFSGRRKLWAQLYDCNGKARYTVHILHVASKRKNANGDLLDDKTFANAFDRVAAEVKRRFRIDVGFTLDVMCNPEYTYCASPKNAGQALESTASVLAIQGFASEIFSGKLVSNDNNPDNLEQLVDWKREAVVDWVKTGIPVILDVSNGYDGRIVWKDQNVFFWGDNKNYTNDRWRNWMSLVKGPGIRGITFNTWNGYTEGYVAAPTQEHGYTVYNWLRDLFTPPPWNYDHTHYEGGIRTFRVYGAICEKWVQLGSDRGFGAPISEEQASGAGRVSFFADGKAIYWSLRTGAHEVHGIIAQKYFTLGGGASVLGLPVTDEITEGNSKTVYFEHGRMEWLLGTTSVCVICLNLPHMYFT